MGAEGSHHNLTEFVDGEGIEALYLFGVPRIPVKLTETPITAYRIRNAQAYRDRILGVIRATSMKKGEL